MCDQLVQRHTDVSVSITGDKDELTVRDVYSGWIWCYPMMGRTLDNTEEALRDFAGGYRIKRIYSDNSGEIKGACWAMGIPHEGAQPGALSPMGTPRAQTGLYYR